MAGPEKDGEPAYLSHSPPLTHKVIKFPNATFPIKINTRFNTFRKISDTAKPSTQSYIDDRKKPLKTATRPQASDHDETLRNIQSPSATQKNYFLECGQPDLCYKNTPPPTTSTTQLPSSVQPVYTLNTSNHNDQTNGITKSATKPYCPPKMRTKTSKITPTNCGSSQMPGNIVKTNEISSQTSNGTRFRYADAIKTPHHNDTPHHPRCLKPYQPPNLRKSISPSTLTPSSTFTTPQTTTQQTLQTNCNRPRLHISAVTSNHEPATQYTIHSKQQLAPNTTTTTQHPPLPMDHIPAIATHPSISHPKTFDSTRNSTPRPINRSTAHPTEVYKSDATFCTTNYITGNYPVPSHRTTPSNDNTTNRALVFRHKNSPTTMDPQVSKSVPNSLLPKDPQNPFIALKEAISSLNETANRLFSICFPSNTIATESILISTTASDTLHTNRNYDIIPAQNLPDIYELMFALPPMTYDLLTYLHEFFTELPTNVLPQQQLSFRNILPLSINHSGTTGSLATLQQHLQQHPTYTRDLWKPP